MARYPTSSVTLRSSPVPDHLLDIPMLRESPDVAPKPEQRRPPEQNEQSQAERDRAFLRHIAVLIQGRVEHVHDELGRYARENAAKLPPGFEDFSAHQRTDLNRFRSSLSETLRVHFGLSHHQWDELEHQATEILDGDKPTRLPVDD